MALAHDVKLRTVAELLDGFGIPFDDWVIRLRGNLILDEFSAAIQRAVNLLPVDDRGAWFQFCGEELLRAYDKHKQALLGGRFAPESTSLSRTGS